MSDMTVLEASGLLSANGFDAGRVLRRPFLDWVANSWIATRFPDWEEFYEGEDIYAYANYRAVLHPIVFDLLLPQLDEKSRSLISYVPLDDGNEIWVYVPGEPESEANALLGGVRTDDLVHFTAATLAIDPVEVPDDLVFEWCDRIFPERSDAWLRLYDALDFCWHSVHAEDMDPQSEYERYGHYGVSRYWANEASSVLDDDGLGLLAEMVRQRIQENNKRELAAAAVSEAAEYAPIVSGDELRELIEVCRRLTVE